MTDLMTGNPNYAAYSLDDIRRINNYHILCRMEDNLRPSGHPEDVHDFEILRERQRVIQEKQNKVLFSAVD